MAHPLEILLLTATTAYQAIASWVEDRQPPPGKIVDLGKRRAHYLMAGEDAPTVVLDHSLGGIDGYFLIEEISKLTRVFIYDRAGYGWSDPSPQPRTSDRMVAELDDLLARAKVEPPYILVGNSLGSYNVRLYAHRFPEKVAGLVLTDGLHETGMQAMPLQLQAMKLIFLSGFIMSVAGSVLGVVRLLGNVGGFEILKPELRRFRARALAPVKRSFFRPQHWLTMSRELSGLNASSKQLESANAFGALPIALVKASAFFQDSPWSAFLPTRAANQLWCKMHAKLSELSPDCTQIHASDSGHFVWIDRPDALLEAIEIIVKRVRST